MRPLLAAIAMLALSGCTALMLGGGSSAGPPAGGDGRAAAQISRDSGTTATIRSRFRADPVVSRFNIGVETYADRVTLRGTVSSYAVRQRAADIAASVDHVAAVDNRIGVAGN